MNTSPTNLSWAIVVAVAASALGCGGTVGDQTSGASIVRDSAGVRIVESDAASPLWTDATAWRLSAEPSVEIGVMEGDSVYQLFEARSAIRLRDGSIAVLNGGTNEVRMFDPQGAYVRSFGRRGDGPGEFRSPWTIHEMPGDSILVVDLYRDLYMFGRDGSFGRRFSLAGSPGSRVPEATFSDGSLLFMQYGQEEQVDSAYWLKADLLRYATTGDSLGVVREIDEQYVNIQDRSAVSMHASIAATDSTVWYARGDRFVLEESAMDGTLLQIIRLEGAARPVTDAHKSGWVEEFVAANSPASRQMALERSWPDSLPPIGSIHVDDAGNLWVPELAIWGTQEPLLVRVIRSDGVFLGSVRLPSGAAITEVGQDFVLTIEADDFGVQRVRMYDLIRPG